VLDSSSGRAVADYERARRAFFTNVAQLILVKLLAGDGRRHARVVRQPFLASDE
jgi:hypothetical protein